MTHTMSFCYIGQVVNLLMSLESLTLNKMANNNLFMIVVLGGLNTKSGNWYKSDLTSYERVKIDTLIL